MCPKITPDLHLLQSRAILKLVDLTLKHTNHHDVLVDGPKIQVSLADGLARQLDDDQVQPLIKGHTSGATGCELGDQFGIERPRLHERSVTIRHTHGQPRAGAA